MYLTVLLCHITCERRPVVLCFDVFVSERHCVIVLFCVQHCMRSWRFEASVNGSAWDVLREHENDPSLREKSQSATWALPPIKKV